MCDFNRFSTFLREYFRELIDISQGVRSGAKNETACGTFLVFLIEISLNVKFTKVLVIGQALKNGKFGVVDAISTAFCSLKNVLLNYVGSHISNFRPFGDCPCMFSYICDYVRIMTIA